jgi:hypothetical protein
MLWQVVQNSTPEVRSMVYCASIHPVDSRRGNTITTVIDIISSGAITRFGGANNLRVRAIVSLP